MVGARASLEINATTTATTAAMREETVSQLRKRRKSKTLSNIVWTFLGLLRSYNAKQRLRLWSVVFENVAKT